MTKAVEQRLLQTILLLFVLLGVSYTLVTPVFEASDELWHYPMIRHLADGNPLPVQVTDPALAGPWKQEASQPPLYYYVGAALTFWIDGSDMETVRWENPHVDNGVITVDGNNNLVIHDPALNPWQGTLLAVRVVRLFSVLLGAWTVYLTYLIAKEIVGEEKKFIPLTAAALNGFMPMFLFISGAVNNDNLAIPLASLGVLLLIRMVTRPKLTIHNSQLIINYSLRWLLIGAIIGLAILTKQGTIALLPLAWGTIFIWLWSVRKPLSVNRDPSSESVLRNTNLIRLLAENLALSVAYFALVLLPVLLIAGWWYWRNVQLYGDLLGWSAFIAVLGERADPATLAQLWDERFGFMMSYWGLFGGVNVPMWRWIYMLLNWTAVFSIPGLAIYLLLQVRDWYIANPRPRPTLFSLIVDLLDLVAAKFGLVVCLVFSAGVVYGLIQWATTTWSSQGRLVFTAVSTITILFTLGLFGWLPVRIARVGGAALSGFMLFIALISPWLFIRPTYQPSQITAVWLNQQPLNITYGDKLRLVGVEVGQTAAEQNDQSVEPGDAVDVLLEWEVLAETERNWSTFVHLIDPVLGVPIAQRDMYLAQGLRPTTLLLPGERLFNHYRLRVPNTAVSPANLQLNVGLYDFNSCPACERLPITQGEGNIADNAAMLTQIPLAAAEGELPNPVAIRFEDAFELVGYEVAPRRVATGEPLEVTLYWRAMQDLDIDFTFFAQLVDAETNRWAALDLPLPTSGWAAGEVQPVQMSLPVRDDAVADVYPLRVGIYSRTEDGGFDNLKRVTEDGRLTDDFINLTQIRIVGK